MWEKEHKHETALTSCQLNILLIHLDIDGWALFFQGVVYTASPTVLNGSYGVLRMSTIRVSITKKLSGF
jgi:hypothetical protein